MVISIPFILGVLNLIEDFTGIISGIDEIIVNDNKSGIHGRMSGATSLGFVLLSISLFFYATKINIPFFPPYIPIYIVTIITFISTVSFLFGIEPSKKLLIFQTMSFPTTLMFFLLSINVNLLFRDRGVVGIILSRNLGGTTLRRILPLITVIILGISFTRITSHRESWVSVEFGILLLTMGILLSSYILIFFIGDFLNATDKKRILSQLKLEDLNKTLNQKVLEQTEDLKYLNDAINSSSIVSITDLKGKIIFANEEFQKISKYSYYELIGQDHRLVNSGFHPKDFWKNMWKTISSGKRWRSEVKNKAKDGSFYWVDTSINPIKNSDGKIIKYLSIRSDISQKKKSEELIKEREANLTIANKNLKEKTDLLSLSQTMAFLGNWVLDIKTNHLYWSEEVFKIFGIKPTEFSHTMEGFLELIHPEDRDAVNKVYANSIENNLNTYEIEHRIITFDTKEVRYVHEKCNHEKNEYGKVIRSIGMVQDITDRKEREQKLEKALSAKSEFLASMSHEIRTPMNGVIGMAELLNHTNLTSEQKEYVESLLISSELLLTIINDILDFSKLEAGKIDINYYDIDIRNCISECGKMFQFKLEDKRQELTLHIHSEIPGYIKIDEKRFQQVVINLLGNAIKFTPEDGEINISLEVNKKEKEEKLLFSIQDTGIGIPEDKKDRIFSPFSQADSSITKNYGGTGLGLVISKRLIEMMEGKIWFESKEKKGTTFYFEIPLIKSENPNPEYLLSDHNFIKGKSCVVIDDNQTNLKIFKHLFKYWKMKSKEFESPDEGIKYIKFKNPIL